MVQYLLTNIDKVCIQTNPFLPITQGHRELTSENYHRQGVLKFSNTPCERNWFFTLFQTRIFLFKKD